MSLSRSLFIAAGAGIAGLALGLIMGHGAPTGSALAQSPDEEAAPQAGAYMIVSGTVFDRPAFGAGYAAKLPPLYARHGGEYVAVTGNIETLEGETEYQSMVISRWPNAQAARDFWNDPDYRELADARIDNSWGEFHVVLVEALAAPAQETEMAREAREGGE
ncbi:MAG: DUF1330 domain-containing protein [Pseudomonadota bacterium]